MTLIKNIALTMFATVMLSACAVAENATSSAMRVDIPHLLRTARTPAEYRLLSAYYHSKQEMFARKATAEKAEWTRRASIQSATAMKYPRPVDSAHYRYEYFSNEAAAMEEQADHFENLAAESSY